MPLKKTGSAEAYEVVREDDDGFGWIAHPEEGMQRASHAFDTDEGVYVVDPVDVDGLDDHLAALGDVAGVVLTLARHERDCAAVANRHDVPVFVPEFFGSTDLDAETEPLRGVLARFDVRRVLNTPFWNEVALWDADSGELWVSEAVGTVDYYTTKPEELGVHPMLRAFPPRKQLGDLAPGELYCGHGAGITTGAPKALEDALAGSRKRMVGLYAKTLKNALS
ncbi:hypothetical protein G9C85_04900 [Halorubellus sp. JP-L1]|uniref:hypothetical protein n=1 Tax=Halorubellus sp. JP-L1 TaxID=2715753 RepID=UPI00140BB705|nr:hypothetical protein [Halorubellus sp. JP-L1]NHN40975.1 hypothetical protein [Halorubellus sp. JP-L1]